MGELTKEEIRKRLLSHIRHSVDYWEKETRVESFRERLEGVVFSVLVAIDGGAAGLPGFLLIPNPHPSDRDYYLSKGEDFYPAPDLEKNIAGALHGEFLNPSLTKNRLSD